MKTGSQRIRKQSLYYFLLLFVEGLRRRVWLSVEMKLEGLRLRNVKKIDCILNAALNNVVTNDVLMTEIVKPFPLKMWLKKVLLEHKPGVVETDVTDDYNELVNEVEAFLSSADGCREIHHEWCFDSRKKEYVLKVENVSVLEEIQRLVNMKKDVKDATMLKELLMQNFTTFQGDVQHDAGDAYLSMLECAPDLAEKYNFLLKVMRKCLDCQKVNESRR